jgi:hypothetical protein
MAYNTSQDRLLDEIKKRSNLGACGGALVPGTDAFTTGAPFAAVTALADINVTTVGNGPNLSTTAVKAGTTIFGQFTSVTASVANSLVVYSEC